MTTSGAATTKTGTFARNATGLVRELNVWDVLWINCVLVSPLGNFIIFILLGTAVFPGANLALSALTAMGIGTSLVVLYSLLAATMPRTGGDYVFISRALHPALGFVGSWTMAMTALFWSAYGAWSAPNWILPDIFGVLGKWLGIDWMVNLAAQLPTTGWTIAVGLVVIAFYLLVGVTGLRWAVRLQLASFVAMAISIAAALPGIIAATPASFTANFNSFASHYGTSATQVIQVATKDGYTGPAGFSWASTIGFWPFMMLLTGYAIVTISMSGEVRKPAQSQMIGTTGANVYGLVVLAGLFLLVLPKVDPNLLGAIGFFNFVNPTHNPFPYPIYGHIIMGLEAGSPWIATMVGVSVMSSFIFGGLFLQAWAMRYFFAWGFDRMAPEWITRVDERTHAPRNALFVANAIAVVFLLALTLITSFTFLATGLLSSVLFVLASIAGLILPWRLKDLYSGSIKMSFAGVPVISIVAAISLVFNLVMVYFYITGAAYGATSQVSLIFAGLLLGSGIAFYAVARVIQTRRGIDVALAYREIPPE